MPTALTVEKQIMAMLVRRRDEYVEQAELLLDPRVFSG